MKNVMNEEEIKRRINKISIYTEEESKKFSQLLMLLKEMNQIYKSKNNEQLDTLLVELENKILTIKKIHQNGITTIVKSLEEYKETSIKVSNILVNINPL